MNTGPQSIILDTQISPPSDSPEAPREAIMPKRPGGGLVAPKADEGGSAVRTWLYWRRSWEPYLHLFCTIFRYFHKWFRCKSTTYNQKLHHRFPIPKHINR